MLVRGPSEDCDLAVTVAVFVAVGFVSPPPEVAERGPLVAVLFSDPGEVFAAVSVPSLVLFLVLVPVVPPVVLRGSAWDVSNL